MTAQRHLTWVAAVATVLTSLSLSPLFDKQTWLYSALVAVALIAAVGYGLRSLGLPSFAVAPLQLVAAATLVTYQFSPSGTLWYGLPTWDTVLALNDIAYSGRVVISRFATPVPAEEGVVLLTVAGVAAVAIVVDLLAVGLRIVPLAGLPLLALYTVPVAVVPDGVPWFFFVLAAGAFVGLLVAEGRERLGSWGRSMGFTAKETEHHQFVGDVETGPVARVGRRIGAAAVCLAVAVPLVIPGIDNGLIGGGLGTGGDGGRRVVTSDPVVDLRRDLRRPEDVEIFSYVTNDPNPDYWRMTTLDTFTGLQWERDDDRQIPDENVATESLPPAEGVASAVGARERTTTVEVAARFESPWLPLPYPVTELEIDGGRWVYDTATRNVFGVEQTTAGLRYTADSLELDFSSVPPGDDVPGAVDDFLELPDGLPSLLGDLAEEVTAGATTPYEQAEMLQAWFRDPAQFRYTLEAPEGHSADDLLAFLRGGEGYCEQFAATMALMARHLEIPARVDVGFLPGSRGNEGEWAVSTHDAHAWPELYFESLGWVRFEPTPSARTGAAPNWTVAGATPEPVPSASTPGATAGQPTVTSTARGEEFGGLTPGASGGFTFPTVPVLVVLGAGLLLMTPMLLRELMTRRRWRRAGVGGQVLAGWDVLRDRAADLGYDWSRADTPRTLASSLQSQGGLTGDPADALTRLARGTERVLYGRAPAAGSPAGTPSTATPQAIAPTRGEPPVEQVRADVTTVVTALTNAVPRARQWRARLLPASTRRVAHGISERIADGLDWLETIGERSRLALRRRGRPAQ